LNVDDEITKKSASETRPPVGRADIQNEENDVVTAEIIESSSVTTGGDPPVQPSPAATGQPPPLPSIGVGDDSVVKANIDASSQTTVHQQTAGDRVAGDKVDGMQIKAQTVVQNVKESGAKSFFDNLSNILNPPPPGEKEVSQLMAELEALTDDPQALASAFVRHVHGIKKVGLYGHADRRIVSARVQICGAALQRLRLVAGGQSEWAGQIAAFEEQFIAAKRKANIK